MPARRSKRSDRSAGAAPPPASAPGNLWTEIEPPAIGELTAPPRVSIVIEGSAEGMPLIAATRDALERQTYAAGLIDVADPDEDRAPEGEVVIFLEAGSVPEATFVEGHARWHATVSDAVSVGPTPSPAGEDPLDVLRDLTRNLTEWDHALFRAAALGNVGVRAGTLRAIGTSPEIADAGLRRLERAYRLACAGALFVIEEAAAARAPGILANDLTRIDPSADGRRRPLSAREAEAASWLPVPPFRPVASSRSFRRPAMVINLEAGGAPAAAVLVALEAILGGRFGDLEVRLQVPDEHPERAALTEAAGLDERVSIGHPSIEGFCASPLQMVVPGVAMPDRRTVADLCELILAEGVGAVHCTVPGAPPHEAMVEVLATGPLARARRVAAHTGEPWQEVVGRLYGERWTSGVEVSIRRHGIDEAHITEHGPLAAASDVEHERTQHLRFRDRADDLAERSAIHEERATGARVAAREERRRAQKLEERLAAAGPPPGYWRLHPVRTLAVRARQRLRETRASS